MDRAQIDARLQELVTRSLKALAEVNLITLDGDEVRPLEGARLMARHYMAFDTMKIFATTRGDEDLSELLKVLCGSKELSDISLRRNEKTVLNVLNKDKAKETIRFPFEGKVMDNVTKVSILAQAQLGCLVIDDAKCPGLNREAGRILQLGQRLSRCLSDLLWSSPDADKKHKAVKNSAILAKCFSSGVWNNTEFVSKQIERVGIVLSSHLKGSGYTTFAKLAAANPRELEMCVNKQPPFGNHLRKSAIHMPEYALDLEQIFQQAAGAKPNVARVRVTVTLVNADALRECSSAGDKHTCSLVVANLKNEILFRAKIKDSMLILSTENRFEKCLK